MDYPICSKFYCCLSKIAFYSGHPIHIAVWGNFPFNACEVVHDRMCTMIVSGLVIYVDANVIVILASRTNINPLIQVH